MVPSPVSRTHNLPALRPVQSRGASVVSWLLGLAGHPCLRCPVPPPLPSTPTMPQSLPLSLTQSLGPADPAVRGQGGRWCRAWGCKDETGIHPELRTSLGREPQLHWGSGGRRGWSWGWGWSGMVVRRRGQALELGWQPGTRSGPPNTGPLPQDCRRSQVSVEVAVSRTWGLPVPAGLDFPHRCSGLGPCSPPHPLLYLCPNPSIFRISAPSSPSSLTWGLSSQQLSPRDLQL